MKMKMNRILPQNRRSFIKNMGLGAAAVLSPATLFPQLTRPKAEQPLRLIVDADTANEVDDLYAIARALIEPTFKLEGLTAAQWHTQDRAPNDTVGLSQQLNEEIVALMDRKDVPLAMGSNFPMVNQSRPQDSAAAQLIIEKAHQTPAGEQLTVVTLGPNTNIASAILLDPTIIPKLKVCYIGFWHNSAENTWNKREFNTNNDPNATDLLLNTRGLDFHIMTASTSKHLVFEKTEVDQYLGGKKGIAKYLIDRWESYDRFWQETDKEKSKWIMWDVAIIEALANPDLAKAQAFTTPHDNLERKVMVYTSIDVAGMKEQYWASLQSFLK